MSSASRGKGTWCCGRIGLCIGSWPEQFNRDTAGHEEPMETEARCCDRGVEGCNRFEAKGTIIGIVADEVSFGIQFLTLASRTSPPGSRDGIATTDKRPSHGSEAHRMVAGWALIPFQHL